MQQEKKFVKEKFGRVKAALTLKPQSFNNTQPGYLSWYNNKLAKRSRVNGEGRSCSRRRFTDYFNKTLNMSLPA